MKMVDKNTSNKPSQSLDLNCTARAIRFLKRMRGKEKIGYLEKAQKWCGTKPFTTAELRDKLEDLSGVRLSDSQV